jgi:hypothetical protein
VSVVALLVAIAAFVAVLRGTHAAEVAARAVATARGAASVMSRRDLPETEKEARVRRASISLFGDFALILGISALALAVPAALLWLGASANLYGLDEVAETGTSWLFILGSTVAATLLWLALERRGRRRA